MAYVTQKLRLIWYLVAEKIQIFWSFREFCEKRESEKNRRDGSNTRFRNKGSPLVEKEAQACSQEETQPICDGLPRWEESLPRSSERQNPVVAG